jgi:hypothetical protein
VSGQAQLHHDAVHVPLDGARGDEQSPADAGIGASLGHQPEHLALARRQLLERVAYFPRRNELLNEHGVNDRAATTDAPSGVEKLIDVGDPTLEQVAAPAAARQERHRLRDLDVRRQEEDRRLGELFADRARRVEPLGTVGGRHPDIDDRKVRSALAHELDQCGSVSGLADDLVPAMLEQLREAFAHQHVVLGNNDSRRSLTLLGHGESIPQRPLPSQTKRTLLLREAVPYRQREGRRPAHAGNWSGSRGV